MMKKLLLSLFLSISFLNITLDAHQTALSYLQIDIDKNATMDVCIKKPLADLGKDDLHIEFPRSCYTSGFQQEHKERYLVRREKLICTPKSLENAQIWIHNLKESDIGVIADVHTPTFYIRNILLNASNPIITLNNVEEKKDFFTFVKLGIKHILSGYDHLLFVLSLLLLVQNWKKLVVTVSAFTIAHSLTLGLATLGMVDFSIPYIEALIALSIVFLVREILVDNRSTFTYKYPWSIAFLFGLIHGFGFASALDEVGINANNLYSALFLFNLGVEIGQIIFILIIWIMIYLLFKKTQKYHYEIKIITLYLIGTIASYWFIQRIFLLI